MKTGLSLSLPLLPSLPLSLSLSFTVPHFLPSSSVWRYRGGRDGHETLQQFMNFLRKQSHDISGHTYPGVAVFSLPSSLSTEQDVDVSHDFGVGRERRSSILKLTSFSGSLLAPHRCPIWWVMLWVKWLSP